MPTTYRKEIHMSNISRRNFIGAAGLAAASISLRADETPNLDAFQKELDAITPKDYTSFQLPGTDIPIPLPYVLTYREMQFSGEMK